MNYPAEPDILVAEGWLPDYTLEKVKNEFLHGHYHLLVTTGFPYSDGYPVGSGGTVEFDLDNRVVATPDRQYTIAVTMRGTKAKGAFPHIRLYADSLKVGEGFSSRRKRIFTFQTGLDAPPSRIRIVFDNDTYTKFADRNLWLYSLKINDAVFPANDKHVAFYNYRNGEYELFRQFGWSSAISIANYLIRAGIPDSLVKPVETIHVTRSKTYTTALDIKKWLTGVHSSGKRSITIFSQGVHARRTFICFKKAFHDKVNLGVISSPDRFMDESNWWRSLYGWKRIIHETAGVLFAWFIL